MKEVITSKVPLSELTMRLNNFRKIMDETSPDWELAVIISKINLYYFTGTMQDGMLLIPRDNEAVFWCEEAMKELSMNLYFP